MYIYEATTDIRHLVNKDITTQINRSSIVVSKAYR